MTEVPTFPTISLRRSWSEQARAFARFGRMQIAAMGHPVDVSDSPAFDPVFETWFRNRIDSANFYLEFGSGASSILAARAGVPTISIESDRRFCAAVAAAVADFPDSTVIHADIGMTEAWGYPLLTNETRARLAAWQSYTSLAFKAVAAQSRFPDLVLVDGRFRCACALVTAEQARQSGANCDILIDDYSPRPHYHDIEVVLGKPEIIGRGARFAIDPAKLAPIADSLVAEAHRDYR